MRKVVVLLVVLSLGLAGCLGGDEDDVVSFNGREYNPPIEAVDFTLTDHQGQPVTFSDYEGKVVVVAFTYTHCPDVCPVIEANMNYMKGELGESYGADVIYLSISIDPLRDTPETLARYVQDNGYDWAHLTSDDYAIIKGVWSDWGVVVNTSMIDAHVNQSVDMGGDDEMDMGGTTEMAHTFSLLMPDNSISSVDIGSDGLPAMNGWRLTETGMAKAGLQLNSSYDPQWGHFISGIDGVDSPPDYSWWWSLYLWNDTSSSWSESGVGIDEVMLNETEHIAWASSNANISMLPAASGNHTLAVLFPDNSSHTVDVTPADLAYTAWDLTLAGMAATETNFSYSVDPTFGHYINNISDIDPPADWSWWWSLNIWNETSEAWEASMLGLDSLILTDEPHISWAPSNADLSLLNPPTSEACDGHGWVMGSGSSAHCMCDEGYQWDGDDHLSCVTGDGQGAHDGYDDGEAENEYNVGHSTVTFIIDREGFKRVAWVGSDWDADEFLDDIRTLI